MFNLSAVQSCTTVTILKLYFYKQNVLLKVCKIVIYWKTPFREYTDTNDQTVVIGPVETIVGPIKWTIENQWVWSYIRGISIPKKKNT